MKYHFDTIDSHLNAIWIAADDALYPYEVHLNLSSNVFFLKDGFGMGAYKRTISSEDFYKDEEVQGWVNGIFSKQQINDMRVLSKHAENIDSGPRHKSRIIIPG